MKEEEFYFDKHRLKTAIVALILLCVCVCSHFCQCVLAFLCLEKFLWFLLMPALPWKWMMPANGATASRRKGFGERGMWRFSFCSTHLGNMSCLFLLFKKPCWVWAFRRVRDAKRNGKNRKRVMSLELALNRDPIVGSKHHIHKFWEKHLTITGWPTLPSAAWTKSLKKH